MKTETASGISKTNVAYQKILYFDTNARTQMRDDGYKVRDQLTVYFITFSVVERVDVFKRRTYLEIVIQSLLFCISHKGLKLHSRCIMSNHIHLIASATNTEAYDRLMIVYRKLKDYKNELAILDRGIKAYQDYYNSKTSKSKKVIDLSNKLAKSFGLIDKKGNTTYDPEPIGKWKKRRLGIEKRLKPKKK